MAILEIPDQGRVLNETVQISTYLEVRGIRYERWQANRPLDENASQEEILEAYDDQLRPLMHEGGYQTADVISVYPDTEGLDGIRRKFLAEHTHTEDEIRYFVEGEGLFWFNLGGEEPVFSVLCQAGDLISVPAQTRHWFDLGSKPHVRAIRVFTDKSGWVPHYTGSGIDARYNPVY